MFQLSVYCRRALNTIPPRRCQHLAASPSPVQRSLGGIPQGFLRGRSDWSRRGA
jgi:hypothetical protein